MFDSLPRELFNAIVSNASHKDLKALCQVSKQFYLLIAPILFHTITITAENEWSIEELDTRPYESLRGSKLDCFKYTRHIYLKAPFNSNLNARCVHGTFSCKATLRESEKHLEGWHPNGVELLAYRLMPLFEQLEEDTLVSFSWELGTCIPQELLGPRGYLTERQKALESLSLITGASCKRNMDHQAPSLILWKFMSLRKLSWKSLRSRLEIESLCTLLKANCGILKELELDFGDPIGPVGWQLHYGVPTGTATEPTGNSLLKHILPRSPSGSAKLFSSLNSLSLSAISLKGMTEEIAHVFHVNRFRTLKLHNCPGTLDFFTTIIDAEKPLQLTSLDLMLEDLPSLRLQLEPDTDKLDYLDSMESPLIQLLLSFQGLEDLRIMLKPKMVTEKYWKGIYNHKSTLRRLVYHEREIDFDVESRNYMRWIDKEHWRYPGHLIYGYRLLAEMQVEWFGISDLQLETDMLKLASSPTITLLHVRRTTSESPWRDLEDYIDTIKEGYPSPETWEEYSEKDLKGTILFKFAQWAFGPHGLSNLQILAFGDFSYDYRYGALNLLLCRKAPSPRMNYRRMGREEIALSEKSGLLVDFLSACPTETLLSKRNLRGAFPG